MSVIEQRIQKNKEAFDVHEPEKGHFDRFEDKLKGLHPEKAHSKKRSIYPILRRVAAVALILIVSSLIIFKYPVSENNESTSKVDGKLQEIDNYYSGKSSELYKEIDKAVGDDEEVKLMKEIAMRNVGRLKGNTEKLEEVYLNSNKDERVFGAIVSNYRMLTVALNQILSDMRDIKNKRSL